MKMIPLDLPVYLRQNWRYQKGRIQIGS